MMSRSLYRSDMMVRMIELAILGLLDGRPTTATRSGGNFATSWA